MFAATLFCVLVALCLVMLRVIKGPTTFDRLVAANSVGTGAILILALYGFLIGRPEFLDIAIVYALLNIVGMFAVLKFFRYGALGHDGEHEDGER